MKNTSSDTQSDHDNNQHMCNSFIDYFKSKIVSIHNTIIGKLPTLPTPTPDHAHVGPTLDAPSPVSSKQVLAIPNSIPAKSSSLDFIPTSLLKSCSESSHFSYPDLPICPSHKESFPLSSKWLRLHPFSKNLDFLPLIRPISALSQTWITSLRSWRDFFFPAYFPTSTLAPILTPFNPPTDLTILLKLHSRLLLTMSSTQLTMGPLLSWYPSTWVRPLTPSITTF